VRRTRNIGNASTSGIELEAKFRLDQLWTAARRWNCAATWRCTAAKRGRRARPDNRLDEQSAGTANLGADYRLRGTPLTLGGNLNWVPATTTRLAPTRPQHQHQAPVGPVCAVDLQPGSVGPAPDGQQPGAARLQH
jgi:outer membrane receptor for ferrienterochelin and colicins